MQTEDSTLLGAVRMGALTSCYLPGVGRARSGAPTECPLFCAQSLISGFTEIAQHSGGRRRQTRFLSTRHTLHWC